MQIVIDINEDVFTRLFDNGTEDYAIVNDDLFAVAKSIRNCTPLPARHGRLIDADNLRDVLLHNYHGNNKYFVPYQDRKGYRLRDGEVDEAIINAPTIVEADEEGEE